MDCMCQLLNHTVCACWPCIATCYCVHSSPLVPNHFLHAIFIVCNCACKQARKQSMQCMFLLLALYGAFPPLEKKWSLQQQLQRMRPRAPMSIWKMLLLLLMLWRCVYVCICHAVCSGFIVGLYQHHHHQQHRFIEFIHIFCTFHHKTPNNTI